MTYPTPIRSFVSAKATVTLLVTLALLLLLNVVLPQEAVLGEDRFAEVVDRSPWARAFLVGLGLGRLPTSPLFLTVLGLFFLNLTLVLLSRIGPTWRRTVIRPRSERGLQAWTRLEEALSAGLPADWSAGDAARTLRGFGYKVQRPGPRTLFGVKHRTAPLGFLVFHVSFFLLCAGGVTVFYTRFVGTVILSEGQTFRGRYSDIVRMPPVGGPPSMEFTLEEVVPRFEGGEPVHLSAVLRFHGVGTTVPRTTRINDPARWGHAIVLVNEAGLAPVLWLQDGAGFTIDRVVAPSRTRGGEPTVVPLAEGALDARVLPLEPDVPFPERPDLAGTSLRIQVTEGEETLFDGALRPGQAVTVRGRRLVLEGIRYWAGVRIVAERGASLLIGGFLIGVVGLAWRLLWYRREVALTWEESGFRLVGRAEYYTWRFQSELRSIRDVLSGERTAGRS